MARKLTRREMIRSSGAAAGVAASALAAPLTVSADAGGASAFRYCLNTSTIGWQLSLAQKIDIAARAGYQGIEPWIREIDQHEEEGGALKDLSTRLGDVGLSVESAIGFAEWIVNDDQRRAVGLEQARRDMDKIARIGGKRIAAPPAGAHQEGQVELMDAARRYRALLEVGLEAGIVPQLELWGFSKVLSHLGEVAMVAVEADHSQACLLLDVYHVYKGGSGFGGLKMLNGRAIHVLHMNDYPADPPRDRIGDGDRVYPGEGVAPLQTIFTDLRAIGFGGTLSLELFNRQYWQQNPLEVARRGLESMRQVVEGAGEE